MSPLLQAGLNVTAIGMGVVFVLLTLMVFIIRAMSALALKLAGPAAAPQSQASAPQAPQEQELVSVISAAVTMHRQRHQG
jgi:oxaloacetate decarboxylase gamma subunit